VLWFAHHGNTYSNAPALEALLLEYLPDEQKRTENLLQQSVLNAAVQSVN
jgi:hypothetical protein